MNSIQWIAHYNDGTELKQYEGDAKRAYEDIDRARLASFSVYRDNYARKLLTLHLEQGQRLIYRKRVFVKPGQGELEIYIIGQQQTIAGQNIQSIAYIFPDDRIEIAGAWKEGHALFGKPQLLDIEK